MIKRPGWLEDQIFIVFTKYPLFLKLIFITLERYPYSRYEGKASLGEKMLLNGLYPVDLVPYSISIVCIPFKIAAAYDSMVTQCLDGSLNNG